ncbi:NAD(P)/FAD-dependent oxidoreductase [Kocuria carniphila]|uniref:NAD(P)/FAD-dependent oxidoreductase n=1 Tax=Kocuria carniphila TaxID=262208 RepID=A0ABV3V677_9MICC
MTSAPPARAVVVGSGPNGLASAITLARGGARVRVLEATTTPGGGMRSFLNERFGTVHDHCSAVHPLARLSPFFRRIGLQRSVEFVTPPRPFAQAMERGSGPLGRTVATFAGIATHAMLPPGAPLALGTGLLLGGAGLVAGWPIPIGGTQRITDFLVEHLEELGGEIECNRPVSPHDLPEEIETADLVLWDTDAELAHSAAGGVDRRSGQIGEAVTRRGPRRYGPGAAKADFVTNAPIPWSDARLSEAATVHVGGTWRQMASAERSVGHGVLAEHPVMLVSQPSVFDPTRAPRGLHTVWAYAHVPADSSVDPADLITREIERYAPGFSKTVLDARTSTAASMAEYNMNYVGGDIASGATRGLQLVTSGHAGVRPGSGLRGRLEGVATAPWTLPRRGWYLCSGTTPPGPGVHGMSGAIAASLALRQRRAEQSPRGRR